MKNSRTFARGAIACSASGRLKVRALETTCGAVPAFLPFVEPCIPREVRQPPKGEQWLHEPKLDGWRCQAVKVGAKVTLYSRHGHDITKRFPIIAAAQEGRHDGGLAARGPAAGTGPRCDPTAHYERLFESLRRQAQERNVKMKTHVLVGHPADQILKCGQKYGADFIGVGHKGRSTIRGWVSGSTSRRVIAHANRPILVVRAR